MLHIFRSPLISLISNDIGPFVLFVVLIWNGCILASNGCILTSFSPLDALLFHFYLLASCRQGFSCGWRLRNILLMTDLPFAWSTDRCAGPSVHDFGEGEFTVRTFIKWHIICMNRRWWIYGFRLMILKRFWRRRIHSDILLLWHLLCANCRWYSDVLIPRY